MVTISGCIILYFVMLRPTLLVIVLGTLWIPQIIKNMQTQSRNVPSLPFVIITSIEHIYVPVFAYLVNDNIMENEPNPWVAFSLVLVLLVEVLLSHI